MATPSKPADKHEDPPKPVKREVAPPPAADAAALFKNGHRIAKVGDPREKWISMGMLGDGTPVQQMPMTPEMIEEIKSGQYYLAEGPPPAESTAPPPAGPPVVVDAPHVQGSGIVGEPLTCTMGNWQNMSTPDRGYQWKAGSTDISGATSSSYTPVAADVGKDVFCHQTATNSLGSATADSNKVTIIAAGKR